jgi:error-prone DNA polymerase
MATFRRVGTIGQLEEKMVSQMVRRGYDPDFAARCFSQIKGFGEYGFPESHAAAFAHLVYISAWIKCHYPAIFAAALLNSQPMGFYAPAQIVRDAREHGVEVRPADINLSNWDCTLERAAGIPIPSNFPEGWRLDQGDALRLGLRQIDGLSEEDVKKIIPAREKPFRDVHDLWARTGVKLAAIEKLAAADAFRSMGLDRRQALWEVRALTAAKPLPLFAWGEEREAGTEPSVSLPEMPLSEHVLNDYQTLRLSLKAHPLSFLRDKFTAERVVSCAQLRGLKEGAWVSVAGVVLVRQRPGSAKGVVFMTIEDETGIANAVIWSKTLERYRKVVMGARLILVRGRIQRHDDIIHVVSAQLEDRSSWLVELSECSEDFKPAIANADEVKRPDPGSARSTRHPRFARHPREERAIPKQLSSILPRSRDFH